MNNLQSFFRYDTHHNRRGQWQLTLKQYRRIASHTQLRQLADFAPTAGCKRTKEIALRRKQYEYYREKLLTFINNQ
nr:hypothetical protein [uncultured Capnocytophaga sp.]